MNPDAHYYEDGVERILRLMKDTFEDNFTYYNGELINVPEELLPCIMVTSPDASLVSGATGTDRVTETILIIVALNRKDDVGGSQETDLTDLRLRKLVYAQDPTTAQYLPRTVMYAIRKHFTMQSDTIDNQVSISFTPNVRGASLDTATQEAYITVTVNRMIIVPSRD